jgi:glyoxylase-like metal-dependent hydrolase (beta-lactamase superfamily II)
MPADLKPRMQTYQRPGVKLHRAMQGPFLNNSWLVVDTSTHHCALIDPFYHAADLWQPILEREGLTLESVLVTHGHIDHVCGVASIQRAFPDLPVLIHEAGEPLITARDIRLLTGMHDSLEAYEKQFDLPPFEPAQPSGFLVPGRAVQVGSLSFEVLDTPGHCPGHVSFLHEGTLVSGDVLFRGQVGFTDIQGADEATLAETLVNTLLPLGDDVVVYPGHASTTTIGHERETNPFVLGALESVRAGRA